MRVAEHFKNEWIARSPYDRFELCLLTFLLFFISLVTLYTTGLAVQEVITDLGLGTAFLQNEVLQDAFGSILTVLILLEFNHSIALALRTRAGAIQVRIVVLIAILALARKLILLDYKHVNVETLLGLGGLSLALGALYWLIADGDNRRRGGNTTGVRPEADR